MNGDVDVQNYGEGLRYCQGTQDTDWYERRTSWARLYTAFENELEACEDWQRQWWYGQEHEWPNVNLLKTLKWCSRGGWKTDENCNNQFCYTWLTYIYDENRKHWIGLKCTGFKRKCTVHPKRKPQMDEPGREQLHTESQVRQILATMPPYGRK